MKPTEQGATIVITHRVKPGREAEYEAWLEEIRPVSQSSQGHRDWQLVRPIAGLTSTYSAILRFDSRANLDKWIGSEERRRLLDRVQPLLADKENFVISSGIDFLFGGTGKAPVRWKQFLATWSALYPLSFTLPLLILPVLRELGLPAYRALDVFLLNGVTVALMVYLVMPRYTKWIARWLFR